MFRHENAHIKLRQIQVLDPLLQDPWDESVRFNVPWRPDPRPMPGILEGLFVFSHVAEYELREWQRGINNSDKLPSRLSHLKQALQLVEKNAKLTTAGTWFVAQMQEWIASIGKRFGVN
jgi:uncharacterized protein